MKSQLQRVVDRLNETGEIDNYWAIDNYILRLTSRINDLKKLDWEFKRTWGETDKKNSHYKVIKYGLQYTRKIKESSFGTNDEGSGEILLGAKGCGQVEPGTVQLRFDMA